MSELDLDTLIDRYLDGVATDEEVAQLRSLVASDPAAADALARESATQAMLFDSCGFADRRPAPMHPPASSRRLHVTRPRTLWTPMAVAAAALLITTGLIALWLSPDPLTEHEKHRHQAIVEELRELNLERKAIETAKKRRRPRPRPVAPTPEETARLMAQLEFKETEAAKDAEEVARMIDARRRFVMQQLRTFGERAKLPDDLDVEDFDPGEVNETEPLEVGRVVVAEGDRSGVLIREANAGTQRLELTKDLALMRGDRIETARDGNVPCTSVRLKGGATIDIDRGTSMEVLGRASVHFHTGRIYAHIAVPYPEDTYPEAEPPFSLQADAGRLLTHDLRVEVQVSHARELQARIDGGKAHLVNRKGHKVGRKGQELWARKGAQPRHRGFFSKPIWRGRQRTIPGLPIGKGNPVLLSNDDTDLFFSAEYGLALTHTGEIDLRGVQITHQIIDERDRKKPRRDGEPEIAQRKRWREMVQEFARLRQGGLRFTTQPVLGSMEYLKRPASGRLEDTVPIQSPAVKQLLNEARKATPKRPLVVLASGAYTDVASAWLLDHDVSKRMVVITRDRFPNGIKDSWGYTIVLEKYRCVICNVLLPENAVRHFTRLDGTRWAFLADRASPRDTDFGQFACLTVPGFVQSTKRVRFVRGRTRELTDFEFKPDPNGRTWLVQRADAQRMVRELEETFQTGSVEP